RAPNHLFVGNVPPQPATRLDLKAGIVVMLELGPKCQAELLPQFDFVLKKPGVEILIQGRRKKRYQGRLSHLVMREAVFPTPDDLLSAPPRKPVLKLKVESV